MKKNLVIIGAGGLAREVYDLALVCYGNDPNFKIKGFLSDGPSNIQKLGYPGVLGNVAEYDVMAEDVFICAIGNVRDRKKTVEIIKGKNGEFINLIHPSAIISPSANIGIGVCIKAFCVISNDVSIDNYTYLQSSVIMGHDVKIGKYCQINSFSFFAGHVTIADLVSVNAGARIVQNVKVEAEAIVGMGSVVLNRVRKGTTVFGVPAKRLKKI
ncbi:MAG: acetyltransferase [Flavobacteriaceae bacterium]|nr:acetyltransferase [Flavobacteriaceae bacterium]